MDQSKVFLLNAGFGLEPGKMKNNAAVVVVVVFPSAHRLQAQGEMVLLIEKWFLFTVPFLLSLRVRPIFIIVFFPLFPELCAYMLNCMDYLKRSTK